MRSKVVQDILDNITKEQSEEFERNWLEAEAYHRWLEENGYSYNTDKSYSLKLLNDAGHFPIGITTMMCEPIYNSHYFPKREMYSEDGLVKQVTKYEPTIIGYKIFNV